MTEKQQPRFPTTLEPTQVNHLSSRKEASAINQYGSKGTATTMPRPEGHGMDSEAIRYQMIKRLRTTHGITNEAVLHAMSLVPRHLFVDTALANRAYEDMALSIGYEQTISAPSTVAKMTQLLLEKMPAKAKILEIGFGCGYQTAVLCEIPAIEKIYSIERIEGLTRKAQENLTRSNARKATLIYGDGVEGYAKHQPFHGILAAACCGAVPQAWLNQLAIGGRLIAPISFNAQEQSLLVIDRTEKGFEQFEAEKVRFVPLKSGID